MQLILSIRKALDLIETRLTQRVSIEELAQISGMSLWHFQRTFSAVVGEPVGRYLRRRRIASAAERLERFPGTLLDLALDHQFESHESFSRAFKAELNVTPSQWRKGERKNRHPRKVEILTQEKLDNRYLDMVLLPEFVNLPPATFVGLQSRFISAVSEDANNLAIIPRLWESFFSRIQEIEGFREGVFFGLCQNVEAIGLEREHTDEAVYLAAAEVSDETLIPLGMSVWQSPGGLFAKFEHRGRIETIGETMAFIYGKWFPESEYVEADGPDIERYDKRFNPQSADSVLEFLIPVKKRS